MVVRRHLELQEPVTYARGHPWIFWTLTSFRFQWHITHLPITKTATGNHLLPDYRRCHSMCGQPQLWLAVQIQKWFISQKYRNRKKILNDSQQYIMLSAVICHYVVCCHFFIQVPSSMLKCCSGVATGLFGVVQTTPLSKICPTQKMKIRWVFISDYMEGRLSLEPPDSYRTLTIVLQVCGRSLGIRD